MSETHRGCDRLSLTNDQTCAESADHDAGLERPEDPAQWRAHTGARAVCGRKVVPSAAFPAGDCRYAISSSLDEKRSISFECRSFAPASRAASADVRRSSHQKNDAGRDLMPITTTPKNSTMFAKCAGGLQSRELLLCSVKWRSPMKNRRIVRHLRVLFQKRGQRRIVGDVVGAIEQRGIDAKHLVHRRRELVENLVQPVARLARVGHLAKHRDIGEDCSRACRRRGVCGGSGFSGAEGVAGRCGAPACASTTDGAIDKPATSMKICRCLIYNLIRPETQKVSATRPAPAHPEICKSRKSFLHL